MTSPLEGQRPPIVPFERFLEPQSEGGQAKRETGQGKASRIKFSPKHRPSCIKLSRSDSIPYLETRCWFFNKEEPK